MSQTETIWGAMKSFIEDFAFSYHFRIGLEDFASQTLVEFGENNYGKLLNHIRIIGPAVIAIASAGFNVGTTLLQHINLALEARKKSDESTLDAWLDEVPGRAQGLTEVSMAFPTNIYNFIVVAGYFNPEAPKQEQKAVSFASSSSVATLMSGAEARAKLHANLLGCIKNRNPFIEPLKNSYSVIPSIIHSFCNRFARWAGSIIPMLLISH